MQLVFNDTAQTFVKAYHDYGYHSAASSTVILELFPGNEVYVVVDTGVAYFHNNDSTNFNGVLIHLMA